MSGFNAKTRYALLAALDLAQHHGSKKPVKAREIAARTGVPPKYLVHILLRLKRKALVNSSRGPSGGYWLVRPPELVSVAEVIGAVQEGRKRSPGARAGSEHEEIVSRLWTDAERKRHQFLSQVTLVDLFGDKDAV